MDMKRAGMVMGWLGLALLWTQGAMAEDGGVSFSRNRMVYPAGSRAISLTVINHGAAPYLVQTGVSGMPNQKTKTPFVVTPPLFRLDGHSENTVRIVGSGAGLPADRESVFYFSGNVIPSAGAPAANGAGSSATLSISMRSVLKLFYRPTGLTVTPEEAPSKLRFVRTANGVRVENPTPYYQSFAQLAFDGQAQDLDRVPSMVAPFGELQFPQAGGARQVTWRVMNDYGGTTEVRTQSVITAGSSSATAPLDDGAPHARF